MVAPVELAFEIHKDNRFAWWAMSHQLELTCSRCLEPYRLPVDAAFDLRYLPGRRRRRPNGARESRKTISRPSYYRDDQIDLDELMREQFYLALPMKPLCRRTARGCARSAGRT